MNSCCYISLRTPFEEYILKPVNRTIRLSNFSFFVFIGLKNYVKDLKFEMREAYASFTVEGASSL